MIDKEDRFIINIVNHDMKEFVYSYNNKKDALEACKGHRANHLIHKVYLSQTSDLFIGEYNKKGELIPLTADYRKTFK